MNEFRCGYPIETYPYERRAARNSRIDLSGVLGVIFQKGSYVVALTRELPLYALGLPAPFLPFRASLSSEWRPR